MALRKFWIIFKIFCFCISMGLANLSHQKDQSLFGIDNSMIVDLPGNKVLKREENNR